MRITSCVRSSVHGCYATVHLAVNLVFLIELAVLFLIVEAVIFRSNGNDPRLGAPDTRR